MLPVSLDWPFLIASSVFSNVYLPVSLDWPFLIASSVFSNVYLPVSLDWPFSIASSVFYNVYLLMRCEFELFFQCKHESYNLVWQYSVTSYNIAAIALHGKLQ